MSERQSQHGIEGWMRRRWRDVEAIRDGAEDVGRDIWAAATRSGLDVAAPTTSDVRALGAKSPGTRTSAPQMVARPGPILRGDRATLTDAEIANIVFNETRALSGAGIENARLNVAHAVMNGDELHGAKRPKSAPSRAQVPEVERGGYQASTAAVAAARAQRGRGVDPTSGGMHFNFRGNPSRKPFMGYPIRTQTGPFQNSNPNEAVPASGAYANTYQD